MAGGIRWTRGSRRSEAALEDRLGPVLTVMRAIWAMEHALNARSKAMNLRHGVTGPQRMVMRVLGELGPLTPGELAAVLHLHPASVTRLAKTLEARKLLRRRRHPEDGRKLVLELGPAAARLAKPLRGTVEGAVRDALEGARKSEIRTALALAARLTEALERG